MKTLKIILLIQTILLSINKTYSNPGDLDPSFGTNGVVITNMGGTDTLNGLALQPDGKIIAAGTIAPSIFALARYNTDGSLDSTFGTGGIVTTNIGTLTASLNGVAIQADGKIVVAGVSNVLFGTQQGLIARYNSDGTLDGTFGTAGMFNYAPGSAVNATCIAVQPSDQKIVFGANQSGTGWQIIRLTTAGALDATFGTGGVASFLSFGATPFAITVQSDGRIATAGQDTFNELQVIKVLTDGSLDPVFGSKTTVIDSSDAYRGIVIQSDGKTVCAGTAFVSGSNIPVVARYNINGSLDTSFSGDGILTLNSLSSSQFRGIGLQSDGKIVCAGFTPTSFLIARINSDGTLDATYGTNGIVTTQMQSSTSRANALIIQTNDMAIAGGTSGSPTDFTLARYISASNPIISSYSISQASSLFVPAPGLLTGQPSGSQIILLTPPSNGILSISADGSFVYIPNSDFSGTDSFTYAISTNGIISSIVNSVIITVVEDTTIATSGIGRELVDAIRQKYGTRT